MAKRVLIVDDHAPTRALIRSVLDAEKGVSFETVEAATGMECLKAADSKGPFDLILLDVNLPDMDGFEICKALRSVDKGVPIVFVTAKTDLKDFSAGRAAGGDSYLVKPIARAALRSMVGLFTNMARRSADGSPLRGKGVIVGRSSLSGHIAVLHPDAERGEDVARLLRATGHRVSLIERGRRVVQSVVERAPDLFILSLGYPDPPVPALVRGVRQALPELPILLLKGMDDEAFLVEADEILREPIDPSELDLRVGALLSAQAARRHLERKVQELLGLYKISWAFSLSASPEALYGHLARQSAEALRASKGLVFLFEKERRQMVARQHGFGFEREQIDRARYSVDGEASSRWNFRKNGPLLSNKAQADSRLLPDLIADLGIHSLLVAPMTTGPDVLGLILVADRASHAPFTEEDLNLLLAVAGQATVAIENLHLHEELKRANSLLQDYDRAKSEFVAIVAHDFRRPLMAIRGFAELVLEEPDIPVDARQDFMRTVISETEQLALLANDTLLITQIETGLLSFNWSDVDLGPFILDTVPLGLSDHSVLLDIPPQFPPIVADLGRLRQVITNLTMNAVKYSPGGGSITVRCRERGSHHVVIEVVDHGIGIPPEQVGLLFQKFARVRSQEHLKISGTGLGLYICRLIVEGHGGQIWVESELGKGSTFGMVLPVDARSAQRTRKPAETARPQPDSEPSQS